MNGVSIIMNAYNVNDSHLVGAVESCLNQEGVDVQLIVSTVKGDRSIELLNDYPLDVFVNDRPGIYYQLNNAISAVKKEWFSYASGDDFIYPNKLFNEIETCTKNNKKVCYSAFHHGDENLNLKFTARFHDYDIKKHLKGNFVADVSVMKTELLDELSPFDEELGNFAYWDFWLRVAKKYPDAFIYNCNPEWMYRVYPKSRHIKRRTNKKSLLKNKNEKFKMMNKHKKLYIKYNLEFLIDELGKEIKESL